MSAFGAVGIIARIALRTRGYVCIACVYVVHVYTCICSMYVCTRRSRRFCRNRVPDVELKHVTAVTAVDAVPGACKTFERNAFRQFITA